MASIVGNNAIGWAQFQLNGGWKNTLGVLGAYTVIVGGLIAVTSSLEPRQTTTALSMWTKGLMGLQMALLVIYGSNRIVSGIRRDITSQMIESHRLMPIPPLHVVGGYIFGAAGQAISLALVNFGLGVVTTRGATLPVGYWVTANLIVATFALFTWTIVALVALSARGALFWVIGPVVAFWLTGGSLSLLLPGISVLATPTQGVSVFDARLASRPPARYAAPLLCQAVIGSICVAAATRKYRRSDDAAFSPLLALSMLGAVVLVCTIGLRWSSEMSPHYLAEEGELNVQLVVSMVVVMWFIAAAMCAIAWADAVARRAAMRHSAPARRTLPPILGVVIAAAMGAALNYATPASGWDQGTFLRYSIGILLVQGLSISYLARWVYARVDRAAIIVLIWLALTWLGPLLADLMIRTLSQSESGMGTLSAWSPIGCLIAIVNPGDANLRIGLIGQSAIALIPMLLYHVEQLRTKPLAPRADNAAVA